MWVYHAATQNYLVSLLNFAVPITFARIVKVATEPKKNYL